MRHYRVERRDGPGPGDVQLRRDFNTRRERAEIIAHEWVRSGMLGAPAIVLALEDGEEVGRLIVHAGGREEFKGAYP